MFRRDFLSSPTLSKKTICVVRMDGIGDFVLWLNGARAIRNYYPSGTYDITLIAPKTWGSFAKASGLFDDVICVDLEKYHRNIFYRAMLFRSLRTSSFDIAINPTYSRKFGIDDRIIHATRARERIGLCGDFSNSTKKEKAISDRWYTKLISTSGQHELQINLDFARYFDTHTLETVPKLSPEMVILPAGFSRNERYVVLSLSSGLPEKCWPLERFIEVAKRLSDTENLQVVLVGGAGDRKMSNKVVRLLPGARLENLTGKISLAELSGVISKAQFLLCNDTGAAHIAAALGTPCVAINGGGHYGRFIPYPTDHSTLQGVSVEMSCFGCNWVCTHPNRDPNRQQPAPCISSVTIDLVWSKITNLLTEPTRRI